VDVYVKPGKYFAEHYDVLVMEGTHVKQLVGKSLRRLRMRLQMLLFMGLGVSWSINLGSTVRDSFRESCFYFKNMC